MRQTYARLLALALILFAILLALGFAVHVNAAIAADDIHLSILGNMQDADALNNEQRKAKTYLKG